MKVFINAASIKEGGSKVVLLRLLAEMQRRRPDVGWMVAAAPQLAEPLSRIPSVEVIEVPALDGGIGSFLRWYVWDLPRAVRRSGADVLFSQTNYVPLGRIACPSLLLEQHAGHFSAEFDRLMKARAGWGLGRLSWMFKGFWVRQSVRRATIVTVQTEALADRMASATRRAREDIRVIPHGAGLIDASTPPVRRRSSAPWRIGYVANWGVQKDFGTLFEAVRRLDAAGHRVRLVLTLDERGREAREMLAQARALGLESLVDNRGQLGDEAVSKLYDELDCLAFPSLCESFGLPMVEAMARGLPVVVAATPENLEVTGGAASFLPGDAAGLAGRLAELITKPRVRAAARRASLAQSVRFSWEKAADETLDLLEQARRMALSGDRQAARLQARTAAHYERHPFDFLTPEDERTPEASQPAAFRRFLEIFAPLGTRVGEIGCGPGRSTMYMTRQGLDVTAVDISTASLALARRRAPAARFVCGTNLALPMASGTFDVVVSDGVIHHTPDPRQSFAEVSRILRPGGKLYLGVYNRRRYYYWLYTYLGVPVRWLEKFSIGRILVYALAFPPYYIAHLIKSRGRRTIRGTMNLFYDYIVTPQATFHTKAEIAEWGREEGLTLLQYDPSPGNVHAFFFEKVAR